MYTTLITAPDLAGERERADVAVFDCRHDLMKPGWGYEQYPAAHIPAAVYVDLGRDLAGPALTDNSRAPDQSPA